MSGTIFIQNRQRSIPVNVRHLRWSIKSLLRDHLWIDHFDLAVYIVGTAAMTRLNETHLQHAGSTDVITFDYGASSREQRSGLPPEVQPVLHGEIFVCADEAITQSKQFRTTWQSELARYVIHGILHLRGYRDSRADHRRKMKREEDRLLKAIDSVMPVEKIAGRSARKSMPVRRRGK